MYGLFSGKLCSVEGKFKDVRNYLIDKCLQFTPRYCTFLKKLKISTIHKNKRNGFWDLKKMYFLAHKKDSLNICKLFTSQPFGGIGFNSLTSDNNDCSWRFQKLS